MPPRLEYQFAASAPRPAAPRRSTSPTSTTRAGSTGTASTSTPATAALDPVPGSDATGLPPRRAADHDPDPGLVRRDAEHALVDVRGAARPTSATSTPARPTSPSCCSWSSRWSTPTTGSSSPTRCRRARSPRSAGFVVTNVFGERFWIDAAGRRRRRRLAALEHVHHQRRAGEAGARPTRACCCCRRSRRSTQGPPTEDVMLIRDEVANMVWGVERPCPLRERRDQRRASRPRGRLRAFYEAQLGAAPAPARLAIGADPLPGHEHRAGELDPVHPRACRRRQPRDPAAARRHAADPRRRSRTRRSRCSRARCCCARASTTHAAADRTSCTRRRCRAPARALLQAFERTRWTDGRVYVWLRVRRQTGRGEGSSGLAFDEIVPQPFG